MSLADLVACNYKDISRPVVRAPRIARLCNSGGSRINIGARSITSLTGQLPGMRLTHQPNGKADFTLSVLYVRQDKALLGQGLLGLMQVGEVVGDLLLL